MPPFHHGGDDMSAAGVELNESASNCLVVVLGAGDDGVGVEGRQ